MTAMTTTREGAGVLRTNAGAQCRATYTMTCRPAKAGRIWAEGTLRHADPDVALESFRPGTAASLELGSGETLDIDITSILPGDEITFVVHDGSRKS